MDRSLSVVHSAQRSWGKTMMVPCDTEYPAFVSERTIKETTGNIDCEGCIRYCLRETICYCTSLYNIEIQSLSLSFFLSLCHSKDRKKPEPYHPFHPDVNKKTILEKTLNSRKSSHCTMRFFFFFFFFLHG
uniref:Uncharacterized protein n=1 Tax=Myripristis murdjan TaxID=586833 RepID=A0A667Y1C0_9TELE